MTWVSTAIVSEWALIFAGLVAFHIRHGNPQRYMDPVMAWHLSLMNAAQEIEIIALFLAGASLYPSVVAYGLSAVIVYWRLWLLVRTQRRAKRKR